MSRDNIIKVNQKSFYKKLKKCRDDSCKSKGTRWDDSCKSKEQDGMTLAKVRHVDALPQLYSCIKNNKIARKRVKSDKPERRCMVKSSFVIFLFHVYVIKQYMYAVLV